MKITLIEQRDGEPAQEWVVGPADFLIGRGSDCDLRRHESTVSRHHCIIHTSPDEVTLLDLGSSNGTYLNGQRVRSQAVLHSGDELKVGDGRFLVNLGDGAWAAPAKAVGDSQDTTIHRQVPPKA